MKNYVNLGNISEIKYNYFLLGKLLDEWVEPLVLFCIFSLASPNTI